MRSEQDIADKAKQLYDKILEERIIKYTAKTSINCVSNQRHRIKQNGMVGFCTNCSIVGQTKRSFFICNDDVTAHNCLHYQGGHTNESVEKDLKDIVKDPSMCGKEYPKLAVLLWVLQNTSAIK